MSATKWGRTRSNSADSKCGEWRIERNPCEAGVYRLSRRVGVGEFEAVRYFETAKEAKAYPSSLCAECGGEIDDVAHEARLWSGSAASAVCYECWMD